MTAGKKDQTVVCKDHLKLSSKWWDCASCQVLWYLLVVFCCSL